MAASRRVWTRVAWVSFGATALSILIAVVRL
jgi:hypothetical protein